MSKEDMQIIVIERDKLFGDTSENHFEGFKHPIEIDYESKIIGNLKAMRRGDAEIDPRYKQPIGYMLVVNPKTKKIFAYQRSSKDKDYGEKRLQGKWSWGVGGHIEPSDGGKDILKGSMLREFIEEVEIEGKVLGDPKLLGYINYDNDDVSKVHFGILYLMEIDGEVRPKDSEVAQGGLIDIDRIEEILSNENLVVEAWSRIAVEPLKKYFRDLN